MKMIRRECLWAVGSSIAVVPRGIWCEWQRIAAETGAAVLHLAAARMVSIYGDQRVPLASVYKVPIAMNILAVPKAKTCDRSPFAQMDDRGDSCRSKRASMRAGS